MEKNAFFYGLIGLIIGSLITLAVASNKPPDTNEMKKDEVKTEASAEAKMSVEDMVKQLAGKKEDEFDKEFIKLMIDHHQGAIDMAKEAQVSAKHKEVKKLANDIIKAQTKEIDMMIGWRQDWGYEK